MKLKRCKLCKIVATKKKNAVCTSCTLIIKKSGFALKKKLVKKKRILKKNPAITVFANPGRVKKSHVKIISRKVYMIAYQHKEDGKDYKHDFDLPDVNMWGLSDGSILITHKSKKLWENF